MNFQVTKKTQRQASVAVLATIAVVGAVSLLFKTYPHLNPFTKKDDSETNADADDSEHAELVEDAIQNESL